MIDTPLAAAIAAALALLTATAIPVARAQAVPRSFFGVAPQGPLGPEDYVAMGDARVGTLRFELFWAGIDPSAAADDYDWSGPDAIVAGAARNGVATLPFVSSAPAWVVGLDGHVCDPGSCPPYAPKGGPALAAWRAFLADAVQRYGPGGAFWSENPSLPKRPIRTWQIWNEQNSPTFFKPKPKPKAYAKLLHAAHEAIRREDRTAEVVLGGMFGTPLGGRKPALSAWDFLAKLYRRKGVKRDFDGVAPHPYGGALSKVKAQVKLLREAIARAGDRDAELWITEIGWASGGPPSPLNRGPRGQAKRLTQAFEYFLERRRKLRIRNLTWYSWRDNSAVGAGLCTWCAESGLLREDRSTKPSFDAFTRFADGS